jgi:hypothetical protein
VATVIGVTAAKADAIAGELITGAERSGNTLVFTKANGETIQIPNAFAKIVDSYPVGSIYMSTSADNPTSYMGGGTWVRWGKGRVPVSLDEAQTEFDIVEETGGEKRVTLTTAELASHQHRQQAVPGDAAAGGGGALAGMSYADSPTSSASAYQLTEAAGGGQSHNNLQPYITCYMWKRTA